jgi:dolichol-phosphate mannosyltransferase
MYEHWRKGVKFVVANRVGRDESFFQSFLSNIYHFLIRTLALKDVPEGGFDLILFDKQLREEIVKINEPNTNIIYLLAWLDFDYVAIPYIRRKREKGKSMWTFKKKFNLFLNSLVSFTNIPLRFSLFTGLLVLLCSFIYFVLLLNGVSIFSSLMPQFDWLALMFMSFSGVMMVFLGILGEYMWKAIEESRNRPTFIIDKVIQNKSDSQGEINNGTNY